MPGISPRTWRSIVILWVVAGAAFTVAHILGGSASGADATGLAALAFTLIVFVLPYIKGLKLPGGTEVELQAKQDDAKALKDQQQRLSDDLAGLLLTYTTYLRETDGFFVENRTLASKRAFAQLKVLTAIATSLPWFAVEEPVRILVYRFRRGSVLQASGLYLAADIDVLEPGLYFVTGNVDEAESFALKAEFFPPEVSGTDPISVCWRRQVAINVSEAVAEERPAVTDVKHAYHGLMAIPLRYAGDDWGMLVIERQKAEPFDSLAERIGHALGNVLVAMLGRTEEAEIA